MKDKAIEKTSEVVSQIKSQSIIIQYLPVIVGIMCLLVCYVLYKKYQTLSASLSTTDKLEKQYTSYIKEQSELNAVNAKKFNALMAQMNQINYVMQNSNLREVNSFNSQMSPDRDMQKTQQMQQVQQAQQLQQAQQVQQAQQLQQVQKLQQPEQRELMPTSKIQTNYPIDTSGELPKPISTTNKKEQEINIGNSSGKKSNGKKVINLEQTKEEPLIEEVSTDDEDD